MSLYSQLLAQGKGVSRDTKASLKWLRRAAATNHLPAMSALGRTLRRAKKPTEALPWLIRAAKGGDTTAMFNLAACYSLGEGTSENLLMAKKWFREIVVADPASKLGKEAERQVSLIEREEARRRAKLSWPGSRLSQPKRP